ncbi:DUF3800 domain-containing protein [Mobiluncus mulieris]|uniref:DUF3800 domain-containing protein n=1 Tax=Mobiluncus mulieris TaxID=2052 RepID=UPI0014706099|nr:DUF3800 domain-containing protein [Mobiluncus mulieris]NMX10624.1 DUF3800 domain-containing protein [Mobiluncus mulieris]
MKIRTLVEYTLFVDESYDARDYYIAGVLASSTQLSELERRLQRMAEYYQRVNNRSQVPEFHGHSIMTGRDDWAVLEENFGSAIALLGRLARAISNSGVAIFIEGVDTKRLNARYRYPDSPHEVCLRNLLERVDEYLESTRAKCKVIADMVSDENSYQQRFDYYCDAVTPGYQGRQLVCIERTIDFVDSREYFGVQSADIVAYLHRRLNGTTGSSKQTQRACQRVYKVLESSIISARKWRP